QVSDPELRALQVGDQRERLLMLALDGANRLRRLGVLLVRPVREVHAERVDARRHELGQDLRCRRRGADGRNDLRSPRVGRHVRQRSYLRERGNASQPGYVALDPSCSSMRSSWLYLATRSERAGAPVLIWPVPSATARSAIVESSVSPDRCDMTAV